MKNILLFTLVLQSNLFLSVSGAEISTAESEIDEILRRDPTCDGSAKVIQCGRSCGEYYICKKGSTHPISINTCPTNASFCNIGIVSDYCDINRDLSRFMCQPLPFLFQCTDGGYYPDPTDCTAYYVCVNLFENQYNPQRHTCSPGLIYQAGSRRCVAPSNSVRCQTVNCDGATNEFKAFPGASQYFYNCVERSLQVPSGKIPVMYRCPGLLTSTFNETTTACENKCGSRSARYSVPDISRNFLQCDYNYIPKLERCPKGYIFNVANSQCLAV